MAKNVQLNVTVESQVVPNGDMYKQFRVTLTGSSVLTAWLPLTATQHTFNAVPEGTWTARWELADLSGTVFGPGVDSAPFTTQTMANVPVSLVAQVL